MSRVLFIFADLPAARAAGFKGLRLQHPDHPDAVVWWPDQSISQLRSHTYRRVVMQPDIWDHPRFILRLERDKLENAIRNARAKLTEAPMEWVS